MSGAGHDDRISNDQTRGAEHGHDRPRQVPRQNKAPVHVADEEFGNQQVGNEEQTEHGLVERPAGTVCVHADAARQVRPCLYFNIEQP